MDTELTCLETRLAALLAAHSALLAENRRLGERVLALEGENAMLAGKVSKTIVRVEQLLASLPVEDDA